MTPDANKRKAHAADGADLHHRDHVRPAAQGSACDFSGDPSMSFRRKFLVYADRQAARRRNGACFRRGPDAACRPRTERFHFRGARDRRDAFGYLFVDHLGHRRAEGPAAWRRQPGRDQDSAAAFERGSGHRPGEEHAGAQGEDPRVRPSRVSRRRSARHALAGAIGRIRPAHRAGETVPPVARPWSRP